jgi:hypothetical protein
VCFKVTRKSSGQPSSGITLMGQRGGRSWIAVIRFNRGELFVRCASDVRVCNHPATG